MKIVIPTNDQINISQHFGRTKGFLLVQVDDNKIISKAYKENNMTGHAQGKHHDHHHEHHHEGHAHSHEGIFNAIGDCDVVIAGGMGRRLYQDFAVKEIPVYVTHETNIEEAVQLLLKHQLDNDTEKCCNH